MPRSPQSQPSRSCIVSAVSPASHGASRPEPRRKTPRSFLGRLLDDDEFAAMETATTNLLPLVALEQTIQSLAGRIEMLRAGKGGPLFVTDSVFELNGPWVPGHLDLDVDEQHGEVRREGYRPSVHFEVNSLAWAVFRIAWESGAAGCSLEDWEHFQRSKDIVGISKFHCRGVNNKLRVLGIRLEARCAPRLVETLPKPK